MQTSPDTHYVSRVDVCNFILAMLSLCAICSTEQAAWVYRYRREPEKRIRPILGYLRETGYIESWRYGYDRPALHRLTWKARRQKGIRTVRWDSNLDHKLAITDLYLALDAPSYFLREYRQTFQWNGKLQRLSPDVCVELPDGHFAFFEVQRTAIETNKWSNKRRGYERYFSSAAWLDVFPDAPKVFIVQYNNQQRDTIGPGIGYDLQIINGMEEVQKLVGR